MLLEMSIAQIRCGLLQGFGPVFSAIIFALDNWSPLLQKRIVVAALPLLPLTGCLPDVFLISAARDDRTIDAPCYDVDGGLIRRCRGKVFCSVAHFVSVRWFRISIIINSACSQTKVQPALALRRRGCQYVIKGLTTSPSSPFREDGPNTIFGIRFVGLRSPKLRMGRQE